MIDMLVCSTKDAGVQFRNDAGAFLCCRST